MKNSTGKVENVMAISIAISTLLRIPRRYNSFYAFSSSVSVVLVLTRSYKLIIVKIVMGISAPTTSEYPSFSNSPEFIGMYII